VTAGGPAVVHVAWAGGTRFDAGRPNGPAFRLDTSGETGQSPVDAVLSGLGGCVSIDILGILEKQRTPARSFAVDVTGDRVDTTPRRLSHVMLHFTIAGEGLQRPAVERAIDLSITKYCSVRDSLRTDIQVEWTLTLEP